jgi:hypothetical protein
MRMIVEQLVEWRLTGETEVLGENLPQRHFVHHKSHMTRPGLELRAAAVGSQRLTAWVMAPPRHTLKSSSNVWSRYLFPLFIVFIVHKPASHWCRVEEGRSASIVFFLMTGDRCRRDSQNKGISVHECFSFSFLSSLISVSLSSSLRVNFADLNALNTNRSLTQPK